MHLPALIQDLAVILGVAAVVTFIFRRIKQPVVLGYITAGVIVGPHTPDIFAIGDIPNIKVWAELGVIFLMFTLGLEFSFRRLAKVGFSAGVTAFVQIFVMLIAGIVIGRMLDWSTMDAIFLGCMISMSSTTIIIKALDELKLKSKKFAELVFGILIVEDLAAIIIMVALTNIATTDSISGIQLLGAAGKMAIVVGAWFLVGMFVVPRFVRAVNTHGNDEMMTVVAIGLCLGLVTLSSYFEYSVALGAFIMGSILAESTQAKRIEHLTQPLKDVFGAVFFVSVGMLMDPQSIIDNFGVVISLSAIIIIGKVLSVFLGSILTGQTLNTASQAGMSMAQIGEFSFIIGTLGLALGAMSEKLYPIIVASSLITTFTTPYLIQSSARVAGFLQTSLPPRVLRGVNNYITWVQRRNTTSDRRKDFLNRLVKWGLNAIVVITVFTVGAHLLIPFIEDSTANKTLAEVGSWFLAFAISSPSIWAMMTAFRNYGIVGSPSDQTVPKGGSLFLSRLITIGLIGIVSSEYLPALLAVSITITGCVVVFIIFRKQLDSYYLWIEAKFRSSFEADAELENHDTILERLAPWDAHLIEVVIPPRAFVVGKSLLSLQLREKYGLNVVVIMRGGENIVAPKANEVLFPQDKILCFATDTQVERFRKEIESSVTAPSSQLNSYDLRRLVVRASSMLEGVTIKQANIQEGFDCMVVGIERSEQRIPSPHSDLAIAANDVLWVVGEERKLQALADELQR